MKYQELASKSDKELNTLLSDTRKQLADELVNIRTKQVANVKAIQKLKKTIARAETARRAKELKLTEESNG
ncbi:MAG TPA: 50S ribosomal protein L29 [Candidatus Saccharimonadales bacterium]|nr:50S ribosomal protein L29 [Candidatus Saccharimonadales bacterium]